MSAGNRQATFSLYTIIIMKLKRTTRGMRKLAHWECKDCFRRCKVCIDGFTREKKTGTTGITKWKKIKIKNQPKTPEQSQVLLHQRNVAFTTITIFFFFMHRVSVSGTLMASVINVQTQKSELKSSKNHTVTVIQLSTQETLFFKGHLIFGWPPYVLNLTSYTVCQLFGKKQFYLVALVL